MALIRTLKARDYIQVGAVRVSVIRVKPSCQEVVLDILAPREMPIDCGVMPLPGGQPWPIDKAP